MRKKELTDERIENLLCSHRKHVDVQPPEDAVERTAASVRGLLMFKQRTERAGFLEFVMEQIAFIQKKWWLYQAVILFAAWMCMVWFDGAWYAQRGLGIAGTVFVILVMPELWKSRETKSIEIEESARYNLRYVYGAKLLIFGFVDLMLISLFGFAMIQTQEFFVPDLLKQFMFPVMISTIISLGTLSLEKNFNEVASALLCAAVNMTWLLTVSSETVYERITIPIWVVLFSSGLGIMILLLYKLLSEKEHYFGVQQC